MAWYKNFGDDCCHKKYKVEVWRWWPNGISAFRKWAKEHNIDYSITHSCQNGTDKLLFKDNKIAFTLIKDESFLVYAPWQNFPFDVICSEDFHKYYLWHEGFDEEWKWNEQGFEHFKFWVKEHDIQFRHCIWDKEEHIDLLKFPAYRNEHNIVQGMFVQSGDILHYSYDKRANGEFPFTVIKREE